MIINICSLILQVILTFVVVYVSFEIMRKSIWKGEAKNFYMRFIIPLQTLVATLYVYSKRTFETNRLSEPDLVKINHVYKKYLEFWEKTCYHYLIILNLIDPELTNNLGIFGHKRDHVFFDIEEIKNLYLFLEGKIKGPLFRLGIQDIEKVFKPILGSPRERHEFLLKRKEN